MNCKFCDKKVSESRTTKRWYSKAYCKGCKKYQQAASRYAVYKKRGAYNRSSGDILF